MTVGLYSPYFGSVWGGGEKYLACAARALHDAKPELAVEIVAPVPVTRESCRRMLGVDLDGVSITSPRRRVTPVHRALNRVALLRPLRDLVLGRQASRLGARYELFLPMIYAIPVRPTGVRSVMLCQFPYPSRDRELEGFELIVCQSEYVRGWIRRYWDRDALVVNPPVDQPTRPVDIGAKRPIVLSVGRFFSGGHSKRQDVLVDTFRRLVDGGLRGWELHLVGGVHRDAHHRGFYEKIKALASGYPIVLHPDADRDQVLQLYREATLYWHAAGYGAVEDAHPEQLEHFGMTTAEAMAYGAVPLVFAAGGQLEVVRAEVDGLHWRSPDDLAAATRDLIDDPERRRRLVEEAQRSAARWARPAFSAAIVQALAPVFAAA